MKDKKIELMTFKEYFYAVNEDGKVHSDQAYQYNLEDYKENSENYPKLINRFNTHGLNFEIREKAIDNWEKEYCDVDDEGNVLKDENGKIIPLSQEKKEKVINPRYEYEHAVLDSKTKKVIARTQEEWNCLLISIAEEYSGMSIGEKLLGIHREKYPFRDSGGHTPAGKEMLYRMHQNKVSKFLANGGYSRAIKEGLITKEKVKDILQQAMIDKKHVAETKEDYAKYDLEIDSFRERKKKQKQRSEGIDYNMFDPKDYLLHVEDNFAILYNKKAFLAMREDNVNDFFIEQGLLGYSYIGGVYGEESVPKLFRLYGKNKKIKEFMAEVAMNLYVEEPVRIFDQDLEYLNDNILNNSEKGLERDSMTQFKLQNKTMDNIEIMSYLEKKFRKENDQYDEKWILIHEEITALTEKEYQAPKKKIKRKL